MASRVGPSNEADFPAARLALSVPLINAHIEPISTAPILATHPFDLQHFPAKEGQEMVHVGPPAANVEIKLMANTDEEVDHNIHDPVGTVCFLLYSVNLPRH